MTTQDRLAALTTDRFVAVDHGRFWFVADTHALDANGTVRVKDRADATRWIQDVEASEVQWDSPYFPKSGTSRDGKFVVTMLEYGKWEVSQPEYPAAKPVVCDDERTAQLYIRESKTWWVTQTTNTGIGSRVVMTNPETGVLRTEVVVQYIAWADNSDEIVGHLGGRQMLSYPSGDACY